MNNDEDMDETEVITEGLGKDDGLNKEKLSAVIMANHEMYSKAARFDESLRACLTEIDKLDI